MQGTGKAQERHPLTLSALRHQHRPQAEAGREAVHHDVGVVLPGGQQHGQEEGGGAARGVGGVAEQLRGGRGEGVCAWCASLVYAGEVG